jgi:DNA modification methylase
MLKGKEMARELNEYKLIAVDAGRNLDTKELKVAEEIRKKYQKKDFFLKTAGDGKVSFYLSSIDMKDFKNFVDELTQKFNLEKENVYSEIISQIESIKSYGIKGGKRIYVGYADERKVKQRKLKTLQRGAYFYARDHHFNKNNNELPEKFVNKIIPDDSEIVLKNVPDNCIDLVFTSPPYNFGLGYDTTEDGIDWNKYFDKLFKVFSECIRVLKYGGRIIVDIQPLFSDYIPSHHIISNFFIRNKLIWKGEILWEKHNYNCKYTAWGSWKSPSSPYLKYTWEFLEVFCKGDLKKSGEKEDIDVGADEFKKWVLAEWAIAPERNMKKYNHPAMFPEGLVERVLKLFSYKGDVILDPFNGVGTTTVVAKRLGRKYLGIDVSEEYCRTAEERLDGVSKSSNEV